MKRRNVTATETFIPILGRPFFLPQRSQVESERVLSLDLSSKTGYALLVSSESGMVLETYGQVDKISCPDDEPYPGSYITWAYMCFAKVEELIEWLKPDVLVIEEITKSKNAMSQKFLDFLHFLVCKFVQETGIKNVWFQTGEWRKEVNSKMSEAEKNRNKEVRKYKKEHKSKLAYDIKGKRIGMIGKKHVTIRLINDVFKDQLVEPLKRKDEDAADAIALSYCYYKRKMRGLYV
jgi:Holliday junction resolvasome RuvABC endonuclease subunit